MNTSNTFLILIVVVAVGFAGVIYFISTQLKRLKEDTKGDENTVLMEWLKTMKTEVERNTNVLESQLKDQRQTLDSQMKNQRQAMNEQTKLIWERLDNTKDIILGVQKQLGGIQEFGKDMKDLSNVLKSPKLRGGLGEQFLYEILANALPNDMYKTQYKFKDGSICDAVIVTDKGLIPVDSKFSLENFKLMLVAETEEERLRARKSFISDVKKRIEEISSKYILPDQGTTEQAVMYIPAENVYYELIVNTPEIEDYAKQKSIVLASPNTLSYFLKVILVAFQQHQLEKNVGEILKSLSGLKVEAEKFNEDFSVLERHISNSYKSIETVKGRFGRLYGKIENIQSLDTNKDQRPLLEEIK